MSGAQPDATAFHWTARNRIALWLLRRGLEAHLRSPRRFEVGAGHTSLAGWFYFRVLCGIRT